MASALVARKTLLGSAGAGIDPTLGLILEQLQKLTPLLIASGAGVSQGVKATLTLQDAAGTPVNTLRVDARLRGQHGNAIFQRTARRTLSQTGALAFDLTVIHCHKTPKAKDYVKTFGTTAVSAAADTITILKHGLQTGSVKQVSTTTTLPGGLSALIPYFVIRVDQDTIQLATTEANAFAGTFINITTTGTGTHTLKDVWRERFPALSMSSTAARYAPTIVNGNSELVTVADLSSATTDNRPADQGYTALASGAGETALTGVKRGDGLIMAFNATDVTLIATTDLDFPANDVFVSNASGGIAASKNVLLLVAPGPTP